ncbi:hypothetical protein PHMEG_00024224, partial [Phytophthora megakarya]
LQNMCPGLMTTWCMAHTLGLLMKDVLREPQLNEVLKNPQEDSNFVRNHTATSARFAEVLCSPDNIDNK